MRYVNQVQHNDLPSWAHVCVRVRVRACLRARVCSGVHIHIHIRIFCRYIYIYMVQTCVLKDHLTACRKSTKQKNAHVCVCAHYCIVSMGGPHGGTISWEDDPWEAYGAGIRIGAALGVLQGSVMGVSQMRTPTGYGQQKRSGV